jgi:protein O-GlcNAc transferase
MQRGILRDDTLSGMNVAQLIAVGMEKHRVGDLAGAEESYQRALSQEPNNADALHLLGVVACHMGRLAQAERLIALAIGINSSVGMYYGNLGNVLVDLGRRTEAIRAYERAVQLNERDATAWANLGNALRLDGRHADAKNACLMALKQDPNDPRAHNNLGQMLGELGFWDSAIGAFQEAIVHQPGFVEAYNNLGLALMNRGRMEQAIEALRCAIRLRADNAEAYSNLGVCLQAVGSIGEAIDAFETALRIRPDLAETHSNLLFALYRDPRSTPQSLYEAHRHWAYIHAEPLNTSSRPHENDRRSDRRLRIGYVSPDFSGHAVGRFLAPILDHHDHERFEIVCYSDVVAPDAATARLRRAADQWHDTAHLNDAELAEKVRGDRIDILVDLALHTAKNRMLTFARKPAPVQATYLAYAGTSGMSAMDWRITDHYLDPPEMHGFYSEKSARVESFWCYEPMDNLPDVGEPPARSSGRVTFGCLNSFSKVGPEVLELWARIIRAVPGSRLLLLCPQGNHRNQVMELTSRFGLKSGQLEFVDSQEPAQYFQTYHRIDIALDPFPVNGGTTTCDAMWMGVPVVTLAGQIAVARAGVSLLSNVGLPELIATTERQYIERAVELAGNPDRMGAMRAEMRRRMRQSPLCDARACTRVLEEQYSRMWQSWREGTATADAAQA